jgi:sugar (pentulose or hexulose) kinase
VEETVLVLDVGKSRAKLYLVNRGGQIVAARGRANRRLRHQGRLALDTEGIAAWLLLQLRELSRIAEIVTVVPVGHGAAAALMSDETLIVPVLDYECELPDAISRAYDARRGSFEETCSPRLPGGLNLGAQIFWQDELYGASHNRGSSILLWPQYWAWWLSGERASEVTSLGCHTDMWRPRRREYSSLATSRGWDGRMPPLASAGSILGHLRKEIAHETGLPSGCDVLCGVHDSNAALHAFRSATTTSRPIMSVVSTGTWFIAMQTGSAAMTDLNAAFDTLANVDVEGKPVATARFMGGRNYETMLGGDLNTAGTRDALLQLIAAGADRQFEYSGSSGKFVPPDPKLLRGLDAIGKASLASLYLALDTDAALAHINASGPTVIEGRFSSDEAFLAALATLRSDSDIRASASMDGVALGATRLQWPDLSMASHLAKIEPLPVTLQSTRYSQEGTYHAKRN